MWYEIKEGDTLRSIAKELYGISLMWRIVAIKNGIKNPNLIHEGQIIWIPLPFKFFN